MVNIDSGILVSVMDPLSAIGVAASIAQFVNLGIQVAARLKEYNAATNDVPKALQHIAAQLPLLLRSLERVKTGIEVEKVDLDTRCILKGVVAGCLQQVEKVDRIIEKVLHVQGDSLVTKVQKVFVGLKNDEKILAIEKNLQTYISVLILHRVIHGPDASLAVHEESYYFEVPVKRVLPFVERNELMQDLEARLFPAATSQVQSPIMVALVGQETAGKTQLAVEYCHQAKDIGQFQTIFWMNAATPDNLRRSLESISDIVRRTKEGLKSGDEKIEFVKSFLSSRWHPWLLVLDGFDSAKHENFMDYLPSSGSGALLFTSRHGLNHDGAYSIQVPLYRDATEVERLRILLTAAVRNTNIEKAKSLLIEGANPDARDGSEWPCLHRAVDEQSEALVKLLLAKGASSRIQSPPQSGADGYVTALYWAASSGNTSITQLLLDHEDATGLTPHPPGNNAVLRRAAEVGQVETVRLMLEHGSVDVNGKNELKETALGLAAGKGHAAVVRLLLEYGADPEDNCRESSPLMLAAKENHVETVKILCTEAKANVNTGFIYGRSALGFAAKSSGSSEAREKLAKCLLEHGADPDRYDETSNASSPLCEAVRFESSVSMLLAHGADPFPSKGQAYSPVEEAARFGYESTVKLLLQSKVKDPVIRSRQLEKALILASIGGHRDVILTLLEAGVDINCRGYQGKTPLLSAVDKEQVSSTRLLIRQGADQDVADDNGTLSLFLAAQRGLDPIVGELTRRDGAKKSDVRNAQGETPLCLAAAKGHEKVCRVLLERGADPEFTNKYGDTAMDLAVEKGHNKIIDLLNAPTAGMVLV